MRAKKEWAIESLKRFGSIAKIAYLGSRPAGLIQYESRPKERVYGDNVYICSRQTKSEKCIGKALLKKCIFF